MRLLGIAVRTTCVRLTALGLGVCPLLSGCPAALTPLTQITIEVLNHTDFEVDPRLFVDDQSDVDVFLSGLDSADRVATGNLSPGEELTVRFDCDDLGLIVSDRAEQRLAGLPIGEAARSAILERGVDFRCGSTIRFTFIGSFVSFDLVVSVNGLIVD